MKKTVAASLLSFRSNPLGYALALSIATLLGTLSFALGLLCLLVTFVAVKLLGWPAWTCALALLAMPVGGWLEIQFAGRR